MGKGVVVGAVGKRVDLEVRRAARGGKKGRAHRLAEPQPHRQQPDGSGDQQIGAARQAAECAPQQKRNTRGPGQPDLPFQQRHRRQAPTDHVRAQANTGQRDEQGRQPKPAQDHQPGAEDGALIAQRAPAEITRPGYAEKDLQAGKTQPGKQRQQALVIGQVGENAAGTVQAVQDHRRKKAKDHQQRQQHEQALPPSTAAGGIQPARKTRAARIPGQHPCPRCQAEQQRQQQQPAGGITQEAVVLRVGGQAGDKD